MKALILNSGMGSRMGVLTAEQPKCMTEISGKETILSRQLRQLAEAGIDEVVMTTGLFDGILGSGLRKYGDRRAACRGIQLYGGQLHPAAAGKGF